MTKGIVLAVLGALATFGQQPASLAFQPVGPLSGDPGDNATLLAPRSEPGKAFSARATTQTTQTLLDGTRVNQTTTSLLYRDLLGRVRIENSVQVPTEVQPVKVVVIRDPIAGRSYQLNPERKVAFANSFSVPAAVGTVGAVANSNTIEEDLGTAIKNGVSAHGTRSTTIVRVGAIGNDRAFRSVSERWFSPDLNLLISSTNTDPRFGSTAYNLTEIKTSNPDISLFRVPAEYQLVTSVPPYAIESVEFRGSRRVPQETLRAVIAMKPGDTYSDEAIRRDFKALWDTKRFDDVKVTTERGPRGGIAVIFTVTEQQVAK